MNVSQKRSSALSVISFLMRCEAALSEKFNQEGAYRGQKGHVEQFSPEGTPHERRALTGKRSSWLNSDDTASKRESKQCNVEPSITNNMIRVMKIKKNTVVYRIKNGTLKSA